VLLASGQTVSLLGNGVYQVTLALTVYKITNSARDMGVVLAANMITRLAFLLLGGALADRLSRRLVVLSSDLMSGLIMLGLALVERTSGLSIGEIIAASAVLGVCSAMYGPAYNAVVPDIVEEDQYNAANSVMRFGSNAGRLVGPLLGGFLYAAGGTALSFAFDGSTFIVAVVAMVFTPFPPRKVAYKGPLFSDVIEGVRFCLATQWLRTVTVLSLAVNLLCIAPYLVLIPAVVKHAGGSPAVLGEISALQVGAAAAVSLFLAKKTVRNPIVTLLVLAGFFAVGTLVVGSTGSLVVIGFGAMLVGTGFGLDVVESTLMQSRIPRNVLSRAFSFSLLVSFAATPIGYVVAGELQESLGTSAVFMLGGVSCLVVILCAALAFARGEGRLLRMASVEEDEEGIIR